MTEQTVLHPAYNKIIDMVATGLKIDRDKVSPESRFIDDLGADSLDLVELVLALEDEFDLDISDEDSEKFLCTQDILDYIDLKKTIN